MADDKLVETLRSFLREGREWERKPTSLPGVFIMKVPAYGRASPRLVVEINPADPAGNPTKKRGMLLRSIEDLEAYRKLLAHEKIKELLHGVDGANPLTAERMRTSKEIIEV
jgi:hypothetical protein